MRDIKFRAWNENYKQMKKISGIDMEIKRVFLDDNLMSWWMFNHCEIMQYTGLNDKNGKEIYEGDVVRITSMSPGGTDFVGKVDFLEGAWWVNGVNDAVRLFTEIDEIEVTGNIYE